MSSIISGIAYARLSAPNLDDMQAFLEHFGLLLAHRTETRLYMRGLGDEPFIHVTELGRPGHIGFAYNVVDETVLDDLVRSGRAARVEYIDEPGGGRRVLLHDPNGFEIELVHGRERVAPIAPRAALRAPNGPSFMPGPSRIRRLVHCAIATPLLNETIDWWRGTLRLLPTDELYVGEPDNRLGLFLRVDSGDTLVHHHILFVVRNPNAGVHHISFEVDDTDDLFMGHDHLKRLNQYDHVRGIGHHPLGRQFFDYWMSPWNQMHEHWNTTELMNADSAFNRHRVDGGLAHEHGEKPPERFVRQSSPVIRRA
jgi:catechol 2,3-dioxygenase-like lactoylglutathione lyase family enzyme